MAKSTKPKQKAKKLKSFDEDNYCYMPTDDEGGAGNNAGNGENAHDSDE